MATLTNKNGTSSADTLTYNKAGTYHAGAGGDTIKIEGGSGIVVYTDSGNNIVNVTGGSLHTVKVAVADADSEKQNGVEKLAINGANQVDAYLGSGKDEIILRYSDGRKSNGALSQIHGGGWTDTFTVGNGAQRYQLYGDAGNDIFNISAGSNIVCWGGAANDTFTVTGGTGIKLRGGDSADIYNIQKGSQAVDMQLGYGNDVVNVEAGDKHTIKANLGINTINLKAGSNHVITSDIDQAASKKVGKEVGYGVDKVNITGTATYVSAHLGDGKDEVTVSAGSGHKIYTEGWGDTITISGNVSNSTFDAGDGDNTVVASGGSQNTIWAGSGNDNITVSGGTEIKVSVQAGSNTVKLSGGQKHNVFTGQGDDYFYLEGNVKDSEINLTTGDNVIHVKASSGNKITTYGGNDILFIEDAAATNNEINLGTGDNLVFVTAGIANKVTMGSSTNAVFVATSMDIDSKNVIECGGKKDTLLISGRGNEIYTGAGDDEVVLSSCQNTLIDLSLEDDTLIADDNAELINVTIKGGMSRDKIYLNSSKLGLFNKIYGDNETDKYYHEGFDYIQCSNNKYVLIDGGYDDDEIYCSNITYGVIAAGICDDTIYLNNVNNSFITGYNLTDVYLLSYEKDKIKITGKANKDIIYGGSYLSDVEVTGTLQKSMILGSPGNNTITLDGIDCQYNKIYCSAGEDTVNIKAGSYFNTIYGNNGYNIFNVYGGNHNLFEGGTETDIYNVYDSCRDYNIVRGNAGRGYYYVHYQSKVIVDLTGKNSASNPDVYVNLVGAGINACDVKVDKTNDIVKINNIYIKGASYGSYWDSLYDYDGTGTQVTKSSLMGLKVGKTHTAADLSRELAEISMNMGALSSCVTPNELTPELDKAYSGISSFINKVVSTNTK